MDATLLKFAARCHRDKWQFDLPDDASKAELRAAARKMFEVLHTLGDNILAAAKTK